MLRGEIGHTKKPDLDNMAKQLKDAMSRTGVWGDDRQVVSLRCSKCYAAVPHWEVAVYPVGGPRCLNVTCCLAGRRFAPTPR